MTTLTPGPKSILKPQNVSINLDLGWGVDNHASLNYFSFDNIFTFIKYHYYQINLNYLGIDSSNNIFLFK
jgi:hypothetical protein